MGHDWHAEMSCIQSADRAPRAAGLNHVKFAFGSHIVPVD